MKVIKNASFGKKLIYYYILSSKDDDNYYFFVHGKYSTCLQKKYFELAKKIQKKKKGKVFLFENSRNKYSFEIKNRKKTEDYSLGFKGKTFQDELKDLFITFNFFRENVIKNKDAKINIVASSLGGTLSSYLIPKYGKIINSIVLLNSGITTDDRKSSIGKTYPNENDILNNFNLFKGNLTLVQGTKDFVVSQNKARKIITDTTGAIEKKLIILKGADHRFLTINNVNKENVLVEKLAEIIINSS
jgi:hypothetical protein